VRRLETDDAGKNSESHIVVEEDENRDGDCHFFFPFFLVVEEKKG